MRNCLFLLLLSLPCTLSFALPPPRFFVAYPSSTIPLHTVNAATDGGEEPLPRPWLRAASISATTAVTGTLLVAAAAQKSPLAMLRQPPRIDAVVAAVGGLLSSSCCLIQLLLNAFQLSCVGFSALDSMRLPALTITAGILYFRRSSPVTVGVALSVSVLPYIVKLWNRRAALFQRTTSSFYQVHAQGVKCEACASALLADLTGQADLEGAGVSVAHRSLEDTTITITLSTDDPRAAQAVARVCEARGYTWK